MVESLPPDPDMEHTRTPGNANGNDLSDDFNAVARNRETGLKALRLLHSDDLPNNFGELVLPVVHCRECVGTA